MAKSKGKVELQVEVKTQEQWDELLTKEGLIVVDAYSAWCGPCKAIVSSFKRIKNELGDDLLVFATAETDSIDSLEAYRMKSQPTFLFYAGGILVNVTRGCNCPLLIKLIRGELEKEHKVLEGRSERVPFVDQEALKETVIADEKKDEEKETEEEEEELAERMTHRTRSIKVERKADPKVELPKQVTVAIIKPDAVEAGLVDEIIQKVEESGMEVLKKEEKLLTKEEAAEFYKQHEGSEHFDQLVEFMSSGPCMTLVLSKADEANAGEDTIDYFRDLIGPKDVNIAKEEAPASLRALYGTDTVKNALHACDSADSAARELAFFYPDFVAPTIVQKRKKKRLQRTLALIRPDALRTRKDSIIAKIEQAGFTIAMSKEMMLSREQAETFYEEHKGSDFFETLVTNMTSGPMMALCLAREDAVEGWRELLGPKEVTVAAEQAPESTDEENIPTKSLRHHFQVEDSPINPLHGSDSPEAAEKEIQHFFPVQSTVAVIKPEVEPDIREEVIQKIKEAGFKIQFEKEVTLTKELASQFYQEHQGKDFYEHLTDYMSSGPTLFMVLTREDAVTGWKALMGPTDPLQALEVAPDSLRAKFGVDAMKNAVHGSSDVEKAVEVIKEFLPEVEVLPDGTVRVPKDDVQPVEEGKPQEDDKEQFCEPLGMENGSIPSEAIKASSELDEHHSVSRARLNTKPERELMGAWVPLESDDTQWLQVNLGKVTRISKIATQGEAGESSRHVKQYTVSFSLTEEGFVSYREDGSEKILESNSDQDTVVSNSLKSPVIAQFIRLHPRAWNEAIGMRTEFYGFDAESYSEPLGMENGSIPSDAIKASSELEDKHNASRARLNSKPEGELMGAWAPSESDDNQWLQVDLGKVCEITKIATQGGGEGVEHRVTSYVLLFGEDQENLHEYKENEETKVFEGNSDGDTVLSHWLTQPVMARYCRLKPKTWNEQIALRLELYGKVPADKSQATGQQQEKHEQLDVAAENITVEQGEPKDEESAAVNQQAPETETIEGQQEEAQATEEGKEVANDESKPDDSQGSEQVSENAGAESKPDDAQTSEEVKENASEEVKPDEGSPSEDVKDSVNDEVKPENNQSSEEGNENANDESKPVEAQAAEEFKETVADEVKPDDSQKTDDVAKDENSGQAEKEEQQTEGEETK